MLTRIRPSWALSENSVTSESRYLDRRRLLGGGLGLASAGLVLPALAGLAARPAAAATGDLYPVARRHPGYVDAGRAVTPENLGTTYNNYYEFGATKNIWREAQKLNTDPWRVEVDGLVDNPGSYDFEQLVRQMDLEERIYRHRCVEAWSAVLPWSGFPLAALVRRLSPKSEATHLVIETFGTERVQEARGMRQAWYPWPYREGLTLAEATNDLTFIATGMYGKELPKQNGAPLRLVTPWKYGFKSIKGIRRLSFTNQQPMGFWEQLQAKEYGFWANVNPEVDHPRWSQASERDLETGNRLPTQKWNGYGNEVASLYTGLDTTLGDRLYR